MHLQLLHAALPSFEGGVLPVLLALFHDNRTLCAAAPRALIHDLVRMHCADRPAPLGGGHDAAVGPPSLALAVLDAPPEQARMHTVAYAQSRTHTRTHMRMHVLVHWAQSIKQAMATATAAALRARLLLLLMAPRGEPLRAVQEATLATLWAEIGGDGGGGGGDGGDGGGGGGEARAVAGLRAALGAEPDTAGYAQRTYDTAEGGSGGVSGGVSGGGGGGSGSGGVLGRHDPWRRGRWQLRTLRLLAACAAGRSPR